MKIPGSGSGIGTESGSVSQRHGIRYQNVTDAQHWL
jgi:hypothetical protein